MPRFKRFLPILALLILLPFLVQAREPLRTEQGIVRHVADGGTVTVITNTGTKLKVRLYGIDAPETPKFNRRTGAVSKQGQPYGKEAYRALAERS
jgi:micrococcal nuclease